MESLLELLHAASYTTDSSKQQQITQGMDNFLRQTPLAHRYLLRVFLPQSGVRDNCGDPAVRAMAGIVLKNVLGAIEEPLETLLPFIKGECDLLNSLEEANPLVRGTAASLLASIAGSLLSKGLLFKLWPELLEDLLKMIKIKRSLGAASALCQICEDWETPLRNQHFEEPIIDTLVAIDIGWASRLFGKLKLLLSV